MAQADDWGQPIDFENTGGDGFGFDTSESDPERVESHSSPYIEKPGWYHVEVMDPKAQLDTMNDKGQPTSQSINFPFAVLKSIKGQSPQGHLGFNRIWISSSGGAPPKQGSIDMAVAFLYAMGLLRKTVQNGKTLYVHPETGATKLAGSQAEFIEFCKRAKGEQFVARMKVKDGRIELGDAYRLDDPQLPEDARAVIDSEAAALWNPPAGKAPAAGQPAAPAPKQQPAQQSKGNGSAAPKQTAPAQPAQQQQQPAPQPAAAAVSDDDF